MWNEKERSKDAEVKVYMADVSALAEERIYGYFYEKLPEERQVKADRFRFQKDKMLSVGAWTLLRWALKEQGVEEISVEFRKNNKPYLAGNPPLYFSLSHSGQRVMCAVAGKEVGCDVERRKLFNRELAKHVLTDYEFDMIYGCKEQKQQEEMFFRLWTLKESYMKATGLGMRIEPRTLEIHWEENGLKVYHQEKETGYYFKEYFLDDGYQYSCCALSDVFCRAIIRVDFREMVL